MLGKNVFVTVGTTNFPKLIHTMTTKKVIESLLDSGYNFIQLQTGEMFMDFQIDPEMDMAFEIVKEGNDFSCDCRFEWVNSLPKNATNTCRQSMKKLECTIQPIKTILCLQSEI